MKTRDDWLEKLDFYKHHIENPLINIINTRAQDNNFERQWIQLHVPNRDLQYAISQLTTLNLRLLQQIDQAFRTRNGRGTDCRAGLENGGHYKKCQ